VGTEQSASTRSDAAGTRETSDRGRYAACGQRPLADAYDEMLLTSACGAQFPRTDGVDSSPE